MHISLINPLLFSRYGKGDALPMSVVLWKLLDEKERELLRVAFSGSRTASSAVRELSRTRGWPESSLWYTLRKLREKEVVEWSTGTLRINN